MTAEFGPSELEAEIIRGQYVCWNEILETKGWVPEDFDNEWSGRQLYFGVDYSGDNEALVTTQLVYVDRLRDDRHAEDVLDQPKYPGKFTQLVGRTPEDERWLAFWIEPADPYNRSSKLFQYLGAEGFEMGTLQVAISSKGRGFEKVALGHILSPKRLGKFEKKRFFKPCVKS